MRRIKSTKARKVCHRNAQVKFGETIAILFIFFLLIVVGAVFYVRIKAVSVSREVTEFKDVRAVELSQTISFMPEFQCTEVNVVEPSCFDLYKLKAMEKVSKDSENKAFYLRELGNVLIEILQVYPPGATIVPYNNTPGNFTLASQSNVPISLFNVTGQRYYFGVLRITTYQ
ncbi:MAG: hypothetical protein KJ574_04860 [Nanoarchaeota archaeon]|nr:hypothetical protein [Nanoarchaeota archaeon]